jgi:hypothetical protein
MPPGADRARGSWAGDDLPAGADGAALANGAGVAGTVAGLGADSRTLTERPVCWYVSAVAAGRGCPFRG